jgi:1-deoxy-D-xylulose-5-phosphate synthase
MTVMAPKDENELRHMIYTAFKHPGPVAFRYPRGKGVGVPIDAKFKKIPIGQSETLREGKDLFIIALGNMVYPALEAAVNLEQDGLSVGVVNSRFVKPIDPRLGEISTSVGRVLVVEENIRQGGLGGAVLELLNDLGIVNVKVRRMGLPDSFVEHGAPELLREIYCLNTSAILKEAKDFCQNAKKIVKLG